ncbi:MAG: YggT family protein [Actinobacteria bacterium]|nr:MAG: YggT family protein [Actinomycetota bacterium]
MKLVPLVVIRLVDVIFRALELVLLAHIILSWVHMLAPSATSNTFVIQISKIVESIIGPLLRPLRQIVPTVNLGGMGLDLSVIVLFVVIQVARQLIVGLLINL